MTEALRARLLLAAPAVTCAGLLGTGYFLQYFQGQDPCPLCLVQRGFYYGVLVVFAIAALHLPGQRGKWVYSGLGALLAAGGLAVAARHVWLQHLPPSEVPACGPDLFFMLENFPLQRTLQKLLTATGQCAEVNWSFLGLSIAEWSLVWFALLTLYALWLGFQRAPAR